MHIKSLFSIAKGPLRKLRVWMAVRRMRHTIDAYRTTPVQHDGVRRLLIMPSDAWTLVGAKGDEAMMQAVVGRLRATVSALEVAVVTASAAAHEAASSLGFTPVPAWSCPLAEGIELIESYAPDSMVVVGADVLDGYYSPVTASRMLLMAEAAARGGAHVSILGFSFNEQPSENMRAVFDLLSPSIAINVRDRISLERFSRFSQAPARLVADSAFLLQPDDGSAEVRKIGHWAMQRKDVGDTVIGFNIHPMLVRDATAEQITALVASAVTALRQLSRDRDVSVLLLSHDYRGTGGDDVCLEAIASALSAELRMRLLYPTARFSAAQLKAIAGYASGIVTGRMHLAVAALGMQIPVAALTYQDKFQGLFAHFSYPERYLLPPDRAVDSAQLAAMLEDFVDNLPYLAARVSEHLPAVTAAAELNLENILAAAQPAPVESGPHHRMAFAAPAVHT